MKRIIYSLASLAILTACATHPDRIAAVPSAGACTVQDRARLTEISAEQAATSRNDAVGVFLIGLPVGSMTGKDHKDEIAILKGRCG